jgi:hypothetical protein
MTPMRSTPAYRSTGIASRGQAEAIALFCVPGITVLLLLSVIHRTGDG